MSFLIFLFITFINADVLHAANKKPSKLVEKINIELSQQNEDLKIVFTGKKNDFTQTFSNSVVNIKFKEKVKLTSISKISEANEVISEVKTTENGVSFKVDSEQYEISKFKQNGKTGIDIKKKQIASESKTEENASDKVPQMPEEADEQKEEKLAIEAPSKPKSTDLVISTKKDGQHSTLNFLWPKYVAAASYTRGSKAWIVFNDKVKTSLPKNLTDGKWFENVKIEDSNVGTIISLDFKSSEKKPNVIMYRDGFNWYLEFSETSIKPKDVRVVSRPLAAPQPRVEIELEEVALEPIRFTDSYVGDSVIVIPLADGAVAVKDRHSFIDFIITPSIQGVVILPNTDSLKVKNDGFLVKIEGAAGLNIAPRVYKKRQSKFEEADSSFKMDEFIDDYLSILSVKTFQVPDDKFLSSIEEIKYALRKSTPSDKRAKIYANWALFNLANGFYKEGISVVKLLKKEDPEFGNTYNIKLIEAVLQFMDYNYMEAYTIAKKISIVDVPLTLRKEIRFWQAITSYMVSGSDEFLSRLDPVSIIAERSVNFLSDYNDKFMFEIIMSVIHDKINDKLFAEAASLLKILNDLSVSTHNKNRVYAISAEYYAAMEKPDEAIEAWDKCIADVEDLKNRVKCRYDKANYQDLTKRIDNKDYLTELENISVLWRGDQFEVDILSHLGDKYFENKDYINSLRTWDKIVKYYPFSPDSLRLSRKMSDTFVNFFIQDRDKELSHLQALAMFYEFEKLVPIGDIGDEVVSKFTDHLIAVDLLERASALLTHQIKNRLNGTKKEEAINKLAKIYLANGEPVYAVDIINQGEDYSTLADNIARDRKYIHAKALYLNDQPREALKLLKGDFSPEADKIKADIYWDKKDWKNFNDFIEPQIYKIRDSNSMLTNEETSAVLKLAISYLLSEDWNLLQDLYRDFKPRMPLEDRNTSIFLTLEDSWKSIKEKNIQPEKSIALIQDTVTNIVSALKNQTASNAK